MSEKKLAGQIISEHRAKYGMQLEDDHREYRREWERDTIKGMHECIAKALKEDIYINKNFYIVLSMRIDRMLLVPANLFIARQSCPTPVYGQAVWKYHSKSKSLEFLWSIPDKLLYFDVIKNAPEYLNSKEYSGLAKFCLLMESGELLEWVKKENGEKADGVIIYKDTGKPTKEI